jgi:hypothetical protein
VVEPGWSHPACQWPTQAEAAAAAQATSTRIQVCLNLNSGLSDSESECHTQWQSGTLKLATGRGPVPGNAPDSLAHRGVCAGAALRLQSRKPEGRAACATVDSDGNTRRPV